MKITKGQLRRIIKEELSESSVHFEEHNWEQESATLIVNILLSGMESVLDQTLSQDDADEYATNLMSALQRHGSPQLLKSVTDIYREIERGESSHLDSIVNDDPGPTPEEEARMDYEDAAGRPWEHN
ncbi:hypothetical protein CMI47_21870 [Candidatus Pacearchaeota archaeon]|nr:hypothetical protein [Candidatus Pacearchaeota archaeon]